ncbi:hypothetical protein KQ738_16925, partial [Listeria monocytogenes]|nr:hypothetical protein [Listeria monocytogenes]
MDFCDMFDSAVIAWVLLAAPSFFAMRCGTSGVPVVQRCSDWWVRNIGKLCYYVNENDYQLTLFPE